MAAAGESKPDIILNSPVGSKPAIYKWPLTYVLKGQKIDGGEEIIETIRWVAREYIEFKPAIENLLPNQPDFKSYECIKNLCDKYNKITDFVMKMNKGTSVALKTSSRASQDLLKHIMQQVYNYAVADPSELNKYSPFSSETYGETSFEFMAQLISDEFRPGESDTFIDLGSGVGHLVLQMAASVKCKKCYGIEIADVPAGFAKVMEERFKFWMNWHGKTYTDFELFHGDFFEKQYADVIKSSNFILVNNFAFKPDIDHKLKEKFLDLKDGTRILSSKPFCSLTKSRLTERYLTDIGSIMHVVPIQPQQIKDTVSWTPKPLPYYLHVLDGSKLEKYYERQKRRQGGVLSDKGRSRKRFRSCKLGSDSFSDDSNDNTVYGPTTRKAWSEWCNASSMNASNRTSTDSGKTASSRNNSTDTENLYDSAMEADNSSSKVREIEEKEKRVDNHGKIESKAVISQETSAQNKNNFDSDQIPKSCLDKKREYAVKSTGSSSSSSGSSSNSSSSSSSGFLPSAPPSAIYSISKPVESTNGSSALKIPNIVIKVKPTIETKAVIETSDPNSSRAINEVHKQDTKVNSGNGKKLRQRKKTNSEPSNVNKPVATGSKSQASSKTEPKPSSSAKLVSILNGTTNGTRSKKSSQIIKPTGKTTTAKKKLISPDKNQSLDLLHAKTVESVSANAGFHAHPAPGCEEYSLGSIVETPSLPKVVIKDLSMFVSAFLSSKNAEKFIESTKQEFEKFARKIQQPDAKEVLLRNIEIERLKNRDLHRAEDDLGNHIKCLAERITKAVKLHCDELGIKSDQKSIVNHLGTLLKTHQDLTSYHSQLEASLQPNQRSMDPPVAHFNSSQSLTSPYRMAPPSATLDLSIKQLG